MQTQPKNTLKTVSLVIGGIVLTAAIAFGVVFALKNITPKANNSLTPNHVAEVAPADVVSTYTRENIQGLSDEAYQMQNDEDASAYVIYKSGNHSYTVQAPTKLDVMFIAKATSQADDRSTIEEQTTAFMTAKGYDKINNTGSASSENPAYYTYASNSAVCQLGSGRPAEGTPASLPYYSLACLEKKSIEQEYADIEKLFDLYKQSQSLPSFNEVSRTTNSEGNKAYAILALSGGESHPSLLFASVNDAWSYLGDLNTGGESNGKYSLNPTIQAAINDPKYGDFLKKNIGR